MDTYTWTTDAATTYGRLRHDRFRDLIDAGAGNVISAGHRTNTGTNIGTTASGSDTITTASGSDVVTTGDGDDVIGAGTARAGRNTGIRCDSVIESNG